MRPDSPYQLPADLPAPVDDGAARHLVGMTLPPVALPSSSGGQVRLDDESIPLTVVYCYPRTAGPNEEPLGGWAFWNSIPGARGCTPQSCAYRDRHLEFQTVGARVYGVSTQTQEQQRETATRLGLPFELLSDATGEWSSRLNLPCFEVDGVRLLKRATLLVRHGRIVHCIYPVFPSDKDAETVIAWIHSNVSRSPTARAQS